MGCCNRRFVYLACLVEVVCFQGGGNHFPNTARSSSSGVRAVGDRGRAVRRLPRGTARRASRRVFPSVARTPLPQGEGVYEGEKNEKEKREELDFNRRVGKVISTLRADYPHIFDEPLDFSVYTPDLQLRDPVRILLLLSLLLLLLPPLLLLLLSALMFLIRIRVRCSCCASR